MNLVVGADGLIGSALLAELRARGLPAAGTSRRPGSHHLALDLRDPGGFVAPGGGGTAFLCVGCGGVAGCAAEPRDTAAVQVDGQARLAEMLAIVGFRVVLVSSSLVFDGTLRAPGVGEPLSPACEYGRQKARLESLMPAGSAIVRVTKVAESLTPRLVDWRDSLRQHGVFRVARGLRLAPVTLADLTAQLASLADAFQPGVFHLSAADDLDHPELAAMWASALGFSASCVIDAPLDLGVWFGKHRPQAALGVHAPGAGWTPPASRLILRSLIDLMSAADPVGRPTSSRHPQPPHP